MAITFWDTDIQDWRSIKVKSRMVWLGFYLYDCDLFNAHKHTLQRIIACGQKEIVVLRWMCNTFALQPRLLRQYFTSRCLQKIAYGTPYMLRNLYPDYYNRFTEE